ncbi:MAG TPA: hypothetical protein VD772_03990, partial [Anseongella sp.]|nr:hypothetical protein [Anseongella sp.]
EDPTGEGSFWCSVPEGTTRSATVVWNPAGEPLVFRVSVNGEEVSKKVPPGERTTLDCPVNAENIKMTFRGDRKLVILQTVFE